MKNKDDNFFWIGTLFLYIGLFILTIVPILISEYAPFVYINSNSYQKFTSLFFIAALILYISSKTTFKKQLLAIALAFCYFYIYSNFLID